MKGLLIIVYVALIAAFGFFYGETKPLRAEKAPDIQYFYDVEMPRYLGVTEYPISSKAYINNARNQSSYFTTSDNPIQVSKFYKNYFQAKGLKPFAQVNPMGAMITVYDYDEGVVKTIRMNKEKSDEYRVVLSATRTDLYQREFNAFSDLPVIDGSFGFNSYESEDNYYRAANISYMNSATMTKNEQFFRSNFPSKGWQFVKEISLPQITASKTLIFRKGNKTAEANITSLGETGSGIVVVVKDQNAPLIRQEVY